MNRKSDQREEATRHIAAWILERGLPATSLRELAAAAGVSDRMLLYYFKDKHEILSVALNRIAEQLAEHLHLAIPPDASLAPEAFARTALPLIRSDAVKPYMILWVEIIAAAARKNEPYHSIARAIAAGFCAWIEERLAEPDPIVRRNQAVLLLALLDGAALADIAIEDACDAIQSALETARASTA